MTPRMLLIIIFCFLFYIPNVYAQKPVQEQLGKGLPQQKIMSEDFEKQPLQNWELAPSAKVQQTQNGSVLTFTGPGHAFWAAVSAHNFTLTFRIQLGKGVGDIILRGSGEPPQNQEYHLVLAPGEIIFMRLSGEKRQELSGKPLQLSSTSWHNVTLVLTSGNLEARIDGKTVLKAVDPQPLSAGGIGFGCAEGSGLSYDEIILNPGTESLSASLSTAAPEKKYGAAAAAPSPQSMGSSAPREQPGQLQRGVSGRETAAQRVFVQPGSSESSAAGPQAQDQKFPTMQAKLPFVSAFAMVHKTSFTALLSVSYHYNPPSAAAPELYCTVFGNGYPIGQSIGWIPITKSPAGKILIPLTIDARNALTGKLGAPGNASDSIEFRLREAGKPKQLQITYPFKYVWGDDALALLDAKVLPVQQGQKKMQLHFFYSIDPLHFRIVNLNAGAARVEMTVRCMYQGKQVSFLGPTLLGQAHSATSINRQFQGITVSEFKSNNPQCDEVKAALQFYHPHTGMVVFLQDDFKVSLSGQ